VVWGGREKDPPLPDCEALRAEQSANDIRSIVAEREAFGNNDELCGAVFLRPHQWRGTPGMGMNL
jgi:hypothetical protein